MHARDRRRRCDDARDPAGPHATFPGRQSPAIFLIAIRPNLAIQRT
jgi:hypothetical protein